MLGGPKSKWKYSISNITIPVSVESKYPEYQTALKINSKITFYLPPTHGQITGKKNISL